MVRILHFVSKMDRGGQETFIMNIYRNIDRNKFQFDFLCTNREKGDYDDEIYSLGGKILYLDTPQKGGKFAKYYYAQKEHIRQLKQIAKDYDIIHLHNYHAFSSYLDVKACQSAGFKHIILHSHNTCAPRIKLHNIFKKFLAQQKNITRFACSKDAGYWMFGDKKFDVIYNGVDTDVFKFDEQSRQELRKELGIENCFVIGMVGRFNYQKNHIFALEVFKECVQKNPDARLVLVGKGELESEIKSNIERLGIKDKVLMLGTRNDVNKLMSAFDILFMPSLFEGLSVVMVEAQYCLLPIVTSQTITDEVIISNNFIKLNLNEDKKNWADKILHCTRQSDKIKNENFDIKNVAKDLQNKYTRLVNVSDNIHSDIQ